MYRTIETSLWDDERVRQLNGEGKLFFVYLITNRYLHVSGIYHLQPRQPERGFQGFPVPDMKREIAAAGAAIHEVDRRKGVSGKFPP